MFSYYGLPIGYGGIGYYGRSYCIKLTRAFYTKLLLLDRALLGAGAGIGTGAGALGTVIGRLVLNLFYSLVLIHYYLVVRAA